MKNVTFQNSSHKYSGYLQKFSRIFRTMHYNIVLIWFYVLLLLTSYSVYGIADTQNNVTYSEIINNVSVAYAPYKNISVIWIEKGSSETRYSFFRNEYRGKLVSELLKPSTPTEGEDLPRGEYLLMENQWELKCLSTFSKQSEFIDPIIYGYMETPRNSFYSVIADFTPAPSMGILCEEWFPDMLRSLQKVEFEFTEENGDSLLKIRGELIEKKQLFRFNSM